MVHLLSLSRALSGVYMGPWTFSLQNQVREWGWGGSSFAENNWQYPDMLIVLKFKAERWCLRQSKSRLGSSSMSSSPTVNDDWAMVEGGVLGLACPLLQAFPAGHISVPTDAFCLWNSLT